MAYRIRTPTGIREVETGAELLRLIEEHGQVVLAINEGRVVRRNQPAKGRRCANGDRRPVLAKGLCRACYIRERRRQLRDASPAPPSSSAPAATSSPAPPPMSSSSPPHRKEE